MLETYKFLKRNYSIPCIATFYYECTHVKETILQKHMFSCPLKLILGFSLFLALNQNIHTQLCMDVKIIFNKHELFYIGLITFCHLNLFHANGICKK